MKHFKVSKISKYRSELMGVATILIFVVHSNDRGVVMPASIKTICALGSLGVDIFLLVSGLGLWYSLSKTGGGINWYYRRYIRILVPYLLIVCPITLLSLVEGKDWQSALLDLSTINFWVAHRGAWYIAMLIPLYAITPLHYKICQRVKNPIILNLVIIAIVTFLVSIPLPEAYDTNDCVLHNVRHVLYRLPAFFIGFMLAPLSKEGKNVSLLLVVVFPLIVVVIERLLNFGYWPGMLVLPLVYVLCVFLTAAGTKIKKTLEFFGKISLESYLFNVSLPSLIILSLPSLYNSPWNKGGFLYYFMVVVVGTLLSYIVNKLSTRIINLSRKKEVC